MLNPIYYWKAIRLLHSAIQENPPAADETVSIVYDGGRLEADLYFPKGVPPYPAFLFCNGLNADGRGEVRTRQLSHAFRCAGFAVLVPTFPEAVKLQMHPIMIEQLVASTQYLLNHPQINLKRVGIFGASYGGTMACLAAATQELREKVAWIGTFGAYASMEDVLQFGLTGKYPKGGNPFSLQPDTYAKEIYEKFPQTKKYATELSIPADINLSPNIRVVICHSEGDSIVPWPEMTRLAEIFRNRNVHAEAYLIRSAPHAKILSWWTHGSFIRAAAAILRAGLK